MQRLRPMIVPLLTLWIALPPAARSQSDAAKASDDIGTILLNVSPASLDNTIRGLQGFGTRHWSDPNRDSIARWIQARFISAGVTDVIIDSFQFSSTWQRNVIATIPGSDLTGEEIVLGAHTDATTSNPAVAPGADDNASGVAAILEIARVLKNVGYRPAKTLRFVGFGAEEAGLIGSADYAAKARSEGMLIIAMINFDMIAYRPKGNVSPEFTVSWYANGRMLSSLDSSMARTYTTLVPVMSTSVSSRSDSYSFSARGFPAVFNFDGGTSVAYHTVNDIIDSLDMLYAADIVRTGLATALTLDGAATGIIPPPPPVPQVFALAQNFPNPFNPSTTIGYDIPLAGRVSLRVHDLLGREVATLADGLHQAGHHTRTWNARSIASGVYLCRLQWEGGSATRRMLFIR
jgi:Peptidase family M28